MDRYDNNYVAPAREFDTSASFNLSVNGQYLGQFHCLGLAFPLPNHNHHITEYEEYRARNTNIMLTYIDFDDAGYLTQGVINEYLSDVQSLVDWEVSEIRSHQRFVWETLPADPMLFYTFNVLVRPLCYEPKAIYYYLELKKYMPKDHAFLLSHAFGRFLINNQYSIIPPIFSLYPSLRDWKFETYLKNKSTSFIKSNSNRMWNRLNFGQFPHLVPDEESRKQWSLYKNVIQVLLNQDKNKHQYGYEVSFSRLLHYYDVVLMQNASSLTHNLQKFIEHYEPLMKEKAA